MKDFVLTRTPHRVSFFGGGTDLPSFYKKKNGAVFSTAINSYVYVGIKRHSKFFDEQFRIVYSETELKKNVKQIKNDVVRETLRYCKFSDPIYIQSISDLPSSSGLGSSSAFTVGLLKAIYKLQNKKKTNFEIAEEACEIEIKKIKKPIGKQDQFACALGDVNYFEFHKDGKVTFERNSNSKNFINKMFKNSILIWSGITRKSEVILKKQNNDIIKGSIDKNLDTMKDICNTFYENSKKFNEKNYVNINENFIKSINQSWFLKKSLNKNMTNNNIEKIFNLFKDHKNIGSKLLGAGAGGFVFVTGIKNVNNLQKKLNKKNLFSLELKIDSKGALLL